jgi:hypothetical protein
VIPYPVGTILKCTRSGSGLLIKVLEWRPHHKFKYEILVYASGSVCYDDIGKDLEVSFRPNEWCKVSTLVLELF